MTKRDYYIKVSEIVRAAIIALKLTDEEMSTLKEKLERTATEYRKPIEADINRARDEKEAIRSECIDTVRKLSEHFVDSERADESMKGGALTEDIKLLKAGIKIPAGDLEHIAARNMGNSTMSRIIAEYARAEGIELSRSTDAALYRSSHPNMTSIRIATHMADTAKYMLDDRMYTHDGVFDQIIGDNSEAYAEYIGNTNVEGGKA